MKAKSFVYGAWALITLVLFLSAGCVPVTEPQPNTTTLSIQGTVPASAPPVTSLRGLNRALTEIVVPVEYPAGSLVGEITFTTAKLVLKEFEIEQENSVSDSEFEFTGPYVVDLIGQTIDPVPGDTTLPAGTYTQIKFKIDKIEGEETDEAGNTLIPDTDPLFLNSIYLEGSYTPTGGSPTSFTYSYDKDAEFELKALGETAVGFEILEGVPNSLIVAFRLHKWFQGINPVDFVADPAAFSETLKENIKLSADYGKDEDGDGELSSGEDDDPDTEDAEDQ